MITVIGILLTAAGRGAPGPKFYPDDPLEVDRDSRLDASGAKELELSEGYDFLENTFGPPGDHQPIKALNVNTLDEVPESSWFTNRIGRRPMSPEEVKRGPDRFDRLTNDNWVVVRGKSPGGFQPGFRAVDPANPQQVYQLEVDPPDNPEMATGAELIGTALFHAIGFNVVDMYLVYVDPTKVTISPEATIRDASARRAFRQADLDLIFRQGARMPDGRYRMLASRFQEGVDLGHFKYYGTRPDDPNDIYPHEHRRELRANRVFCAWVNHDDSRAVNSLEMLVEENGRKYVKHYMYDFGSILGSATRFKDTRQSGREYLLEKRPSLLTLVTFGFYLRPWVLVDFPDAPRSVGRFEADAFEPDEWKAEYPNAAFSNMRPADAFWGARIVASFSDEAIRAAVGKAQYTDAQATEFLTQALIKRRNKIAEVWLNRVNPVLDFTLSADGSLTFDNAAVKARAADAAQSYTLQWSRFNNNEQTHEKVGGEMTVTDMRAAAPAEVLQGTEYIAVTVKGRHPAHPAWASPAIAYFRRTGDGWKTVGLERPEQGKD